MGRSDYMGYQGAPENSWILEITKDDFYGALIYSPVDRELDGKPALYLEGHSDSMQVYGGWTEGRSIKGLKNAKKLVSFLKKDPSKLSEKYLKSLGADIYNVDTFS